MSSTVPAAPTVPFPDPSSPLCIPSTSKRASLAGLPVELQDKIARCAVDSIWDGIEPEEEGDVPPTPLQVLKGLYAANRHFYKLCASLVWSELELKPASNEALVRLVEAVLPAKGGFVKHIAFGACGDDRDWAALLDSSASPAVPGSTAVSEAAALRGRRIVTILQAEATAPDTLPDEAFSARAGRARDLLQAAVLRRCPKVQTVNYEEHHYLPWDPAVRAPPDALDYGYPTHTFPARDYVFDVLCRERAATLLHLSIRMFKGRPNLDKLVSLARAALSSAIAAQSRLTKLSILGDDLLDDSFGTAIFRSPLHTLKLAGYNTDMTLSSVCTLLNQHAPRLTELAIMSVLDETALASNIPLNLPRLATLDLGSNVTQDLLPLLHAARLSHFILHYNPDLRFSHLEPFLLRHRRTLKLVEVYFPEELAFAEADAKAMREWGAQTGVEVVVVREEDEHDEEEV
ncbi:hypothetical protein JCM10207_004902 [Rhodosporidiobolus poonsookiae]